MSLHWVVLGEAALVPVAPLAAAVSRHVCGHVCLGVRDFMTMVKPCVMQRHCVSCFV